MSQPHLKLSLLGLNKWWLGNEQHSRALLNPVMKRFLKAVRLYPKSGEIIAPFSNAQSTTLNLGRNKVNASEYIGCIFHYRNQITIFEDSRI
jgi:hypothetical protein